MVGADHHILQDAEAGKRLRYLEGAGNPAGADAMRRQTGNVAAEKPHAAGISLDESGNAGKERRLARSVRADQCHDLIVSDIQRNTFDGRQAAEGLREGLHLKHGALPCLRLENRPIRPSGSQATMAIRTAP